MRRGAWSGPFPPQIPKSWKNEVSQPLAPQPRPGREGTQRREGRGAAHLGAEGVASGALPPPPLSGRRDSALSALLRPRSAPAPSAPRSLPPSGQGLPPSSGGRVGGGRSYAFRALWLTWTTLIPAPRPVPAKLLGG